MTAAGVFALILFAGCVPPAENTAFVSLPPGFHPYMVFDIGVTDFNGDGNLDIFSTNCFSPPNLLAGDGQGGFRQARTEMGLDHTPGIPGFGAWETPPPIKKPGLYVYLVGRYLNIQAVNDGSLPALRGSIQLICRENITESHGADFHVERRLDPSGLITRTVRFAFAGDGLLKLKPEPMFTDPMILELDDAVPLDHVFVGPDNAPAPARRFVRGHLRRAARCFSNTPAPARRFVLSIQDPHSMAWADINEDERPDVFIGRGALHSNPELGARIAELEDRLLLNRGNVYENIVFAAGLQKKGCPNRKSCWVDANSDGVLDLFYVGARGTPSWLYIRTTLAPPAFEDRSADFGLDRLPNTAFCWRDFDRDGRMDVAASQDGCLAVFFGGAPPGHQVTRVTLAESKETPSQVLAADYDQDDDDDLLYVSEKGSLDFFANTAPRVFEAVDLASLGLPAKGLAASWCDYDNDGQLDLLVAPGELYRQAPLGLFAPTGLLTELFPDLPAEPICIWLSWFDMDNNGTRDLLATARLLETKIEPPPVWPDPYQARTVLLKNTLTENHWLEVGLVGPDGNRPALGARVMVCAGTMGQTGEIGDAEGSLASQGHYRLYFGLGASASVDTLIVTWPDGTTLEREGIEANQIVTFRYGERTLSSILRQPSDQLGP